VAELPAEHMSRAVPLPAATCPSGVAAPRPHCGVCAPTMSIPTEHLANVAVKIKLQRLGKIRNPQYRIVVADARTKRDGKVIENVGKYHPKEDPSFIEVNSDRVQYWLSVGAQPTEPVTVILKLIGDWQKHKGLPAPEKPLLTKAPRPDKRALFDAALAEAGAEPQVEATTPRKRAAKKAPAKAAAESTESADAGTSGS
jgi:small subunit ribosomal protein S16